MIGSDGERHDWQRHGRRAKRAFLVTVSAWTFGPHLPAMAVIKQAGRWPVGCTVTKSENHNMHRYLSALALGAALFVPAALIAQDRETPPQVDHSRDKRYYDRTGKDWHEWNPNEDHVYRQYLQDNHQQDRDFAKLNSRQRDDYFKWRHAHPDSPDKR
jgi:hypothetical protein